MKHLTAHLNCSPWEDDHGDLHLSRDPDYATITAEDTEPNYHRIVEMLNTGMNAGVIHSFHVQRSGDPVPVIDGFPTRAEIVKAISLMKDCIKGGCLGDGDERAAKVLIACAKSQLRN